MLTLFSFCWCSPTCWEFQLIVFSQPDSFFGNCFFTYLWCANYLVVFSTKAQLLFLQTKYCKCIKRAFKIVLGQLIPWICANAVDTMLHSFQYIVVQQLLSGVECWAVIEILNIFYIICNIARFCCSDFCWIHCIKVPLF